MPVVTVSTLPHAGQHDLLRAIANAVQLALSLEDGDVIALAVPAVAVVASGEPHGGPDRRWTLIAIHGSDRGADATRRARDAAVEAATEWNRRFDPDQEGVWCEWLLPQHP